MKPSFLFGLSLLFLLLSGCTQLNHLRIAQDHFSDGAALENKSYFGINEPAAGDPVSPDIPADWYLSQPSPNTYYQMAYQSIKQALEKPDALQNDQLLGQALSLKALCEWKLKRYDAAGQSAQMAHQELRKQQIPLNRDIAVMEAIAGLIANDLAYEAIQDFQQQALEWMSQPIRTEEALRIFTKIEQHYAQQIGTAQEQGRLRKAIQIFDESRIPLSEDHPMQTYLTLAQLSSLKNWLDELDTIDQLISQFGSAQGSMNWQKWLEVELSAYNTEKTTYLSLLKEQLPEKAESPLYRWWDTRLFAGSE